MISQGGGGCSRLAAAGLATRTTWPFAHLGDAPVEMMEDTEPAAAAAEARHGLNNFLN
jgi:hypothetical protein